MEDPQVLGAAIADHLARAPEGSRQQRILRQLAQSHEAALRRRAAVLAHPDLAAELTRPPLNFARPGQWNGYIPPPTAVLDEGELLRHLLTDGRFYFNEADRRTVGEVPNEAAERAVLLALSAAAWERQHEGSPNGSA